MSRARPPMSRRPGRASARGMSLIEVLTSVLIFSIGLIALVGLQTRAVRFSLSAEDTNRASLLADELASEMRLTESATLSSERLTYWQARAASASAGGLPNGTLTVAEGDFARSADITITWVPPGTSASAPNRFSTQVILQ